MKIQAKSILALALAIIIQLQLTACETLSSQDVVFLHANQNLQFQNATGMGLTQEQLKSFIEIANYASLIYGEDVQKTAKFIKLRMDSLFGKPLYYFHVIIQTDMVVSGCYAYVNFDGVYASLKGINQIYPKWSYFFTRDLGSSNITDYPYVTIGSKGNGITSWMYDIINQSAQESTPAGKCTCSRESLQNISQSISKPTTLGWSVLCDDKGVTQGLIKSYGEYYLSYKVKSCYYMIYS